MDYSRKEFLGTLGLSAGALLLTPKLNSLGLLQPQNLAGLQLWTIKEDMLADAKKTIFNVGKIGYKQIENCELAKGLFWGYTPTEFKTICDDAGVEVISSHCNINENFDQKVEQAASIGMKYLICPWVGPQTSIDDFKKIAVKFNELGSICKKSGIKFAYHNHDYSFQLVDGKMPQDIMMQETDPQLVSFEMDIYWVVVAGQDPIKWIKKYPNRFKLCHIKDRLKNANSGDRDMSSIIGKGSIDYTTIIPQLRKNNMEYYIVEQERFTEGTPLFCAEADFRAMKKLGFK